jgi:hypothetical protein
MIKVDVSINEIKINVLYTLKKVETRFVNVDKIGKFGSLITMAKLYHSR